MRFAFGAAVLAASLSFAAWAAEAPKPTHGIAMHGLPKYAADFTHFAYVNPNAPKGGDVRLHALGGFDSLNPFIVKGESAAGVGQLMFQSLLTNAADEAFSEYGQIAESIETPDDRSWVAFTIRKEARFHDGKPIMADDVLFSLETLKSKGAPFYRFYYQGVAKGEKLSERKVKFTFQAGDNRELPLILGQMPILSKAYWEKRGFDSTTLDVPVGSGPYRIEKFEPGRFIIFVRDKDFWGRNVPALKGHFNFDRIRFDYYRDSTVALEAFKAGEYDFRAENESKKWATAYDFPAIASGQAKKESIPNNRPTGMQGFVFNLRRSQFQDRRVREALGLAFDFEWANKNLFYGQYVRTESFFSNSELASRGISSAEELKVLEPLRAKLPVEAFTQEFHAPVTDGTGNPRDNLKKAFALLKDAGWTVKDRKLINDKTGKPFVFEILLNQPTWERIALPFVENLKRLGIEASVRTVDSAQYKNRTDSFDYDMVVDVWGQSNSPGNEQREFWGSHAADMQGSRNSAGIKDSAVDALVDLVISAPDRESLVTRARALDRALLWGHYVIPHWHINYDRVVFWDKFGRPDSKEPLGAQFFIWWIDPAKAARFGKSP